MAKHVHVHIHDSRKTSDGAADQLVTKYTQKINQVLAEARREFAALPEEEKGKIDFSRFLKYLHSLIPSN